MKWIHLISVMTFVFLVFFSTVLTSVKLRHYEKATKFEKISLLFWQNSCFYSVASKQVGDFFKFLWPSQKSWTLRERKSWINWNKGLVDPCRSNKLCIDWDTMERYTCLYQMGFLGNKFKLLPKIPFGKDECTIQPYPGCYTAH